MAQSLAHKFGQIIGDLLELALEPQLQQFAKKNKLFLDKKGIRPARSGKKVTWKDDNGNSHDLDFVIERGGTATKVGAPVAFIESAWRRYTKHSRNKAQEIQSAILPLAEKHKNSSPFIGVVLAGVFTEGAINQLKSNGFGVLYFSYETVVQAFSKHGINAAFDEKTSEQEFSKKIDAWDKLSNKADVAKELLKLNKKGVDEFFNLLSKSVSRYVEQVIILPLHGQETIVNTLFEAMECLNRYNEDASTLPIHKYEITVKYNTGDRIDASFKDKEDSKKFLSHFL